MTPPNLLLAYHVSHLDLSPEPYVGEPTLQLVLFFNAKLKRYLPYNVRNQERPGLQSSWREIQVHLLMPYGCMAK